MSDPSNAVDCIIMRWYLPLIATVLVGWFPIAKVAEVIRGPTNNQFTVESLPTTIAERDEIHKIQMKLILGYFCLNLGAIARIASVAPVATETVNVCVSDFAQHPTNNKQISRTDTNL